MLKRMEKEQKTELIMLLIGGILWLGALFIPEGWVRIAVFIAIYIYAAFEVIKGTIEEFKDGEIFSEEFLMTLATVGALILGEYPEAVAVMLLYRLGEWFADLAVDSSRESIGSLAALRPDKARVIRNGNEIEVPAEDVNVGETMVVLPGERVALDGEIISGRTTLDASSLTGESLPQEKQAGDEIFSGCVNLSGRVEVKVLSAQGESAVDRILNLTQEAKERKAKVEDFIHRFAKIYTPCVIVCAAILAIVPSIITGNVSEWVHKALVFLTVSCPCALVVSVPLSFFCGIGCASKRGVLIKGSVYLEQLADANICAFDKTGTLTTGGFSVKEVQAAELEPDALLKLASAAESFSSHPIAKCIAASDDGALPRELVYEKAGMGVCAIVDGKRVLAGNKKLLGSEGVGVSDEAIIGVLIAVDGKFAGAISVSDDIKPSAGQAVSRLKSLGIVKTVMLSGDAKASARAVANECGIDEVYAELSPEDKLKRMSELKQSGKPVYLGDGINDAPVLAEANVGIAMGGLGSDAAIETADIVIMDDNLNRLPTAIKISRKTKRIALENIIVSLAAKLAILILGVFIRLPMYIAIAGDVGVLLLAVLNALRCWRTDEN